jgi:peptide/nickel transport system permease protein
MLVAFILGPGLLNTSLALIVVWWPSYARLMRSQALTLKERTYIEASKGLGANPWRVIFQHILPNSLAPLLVQVSMGMGFVVLTAAGLGFLGLGARPPAPEWGRMISDGRGFFLEAWWYPFFPGIAIAITVVAFNMIGNGLRDWADPKLSSNR